MLREALWIIKNNASGTSVLAKKLAKNFMTPLAVSRFINKMYYNKHLNTSFCLDTFKSHVRNNQISSANFKDIMEDFHSLQGSTSRNLINILHQFCIDMQTLFSIEIIYSSIQM